MFLFTCVKHNNLYVYGNGVMHIVHCGHTEHSPIIVHFNCVHKSLSIIYLILLYG